MLAVRMTRCFMRPMTRTRLPCFWMQSEPLMVLMRRSLMRPMMRTRMLQ